MQPIQSVAVDRRRQRNMKFCPIDWPRDHEAIRNLDTSFTTDRIYALRKKRLSFSLVEEQSAAPITKRYQVALTQESVQAALAAVAAYEGSVFVGFAVVTEEAWNRRAVVTDFYVDPRVRRRGVGKKMMEEIWERVPSAGDRVLWVETQSVNLPAIKFYRSIGFEVCGFDSALYDEPFSTEIALYLSMTLPMK